MTWAAMPVPEVLTEPIVTWTGTDPSNLNAASIVTDPNLPPVDDTRIDALLRTVRNADWSNDH